MRTHLKRYDFRAAICGVEGCEDNLLGFTPACFGGGSSSSSSSGTQITNTVTQSTSGANSPAIAAKDNAVINYTDGGAIAAMSDVAKLALQTASVDTTNLFQNISDAIAAQQQTQMQAYAAEQTLLQSSLQSQAALAQTVQTGGQSNTNDLLFKLAGVAAAIVTVIVFFRRPVKS